MFQILEPFFYRSYFAPTGGASVPWIIPEWMVYKAKRGKM